jgi:two-component system, cell cycle sensor histidine kinase and response regulator CckA
MDSPRTIEPLNFVDSSPPHSSNGSDGKTAPPPEQDAARPAPTRPVELQFTLDRQVRVEQVPSSRAVWPALRLLAGILLAILMADVVWLGLAASAVPLSAGASLAIHSVVSAIALFAAAYLLSLSPLLSQLQRRSIQFNRFSQDLEQRLAVQCAELAGTKAKLESEIVLRQKAEGEARDLAQTLERRVSEQSAHLEATVRGLQTELAEGKMIAETWREGEKCYRHLLEIANEGIWTVNAQGQTSFMNRHGAELLGYSVSEILGRPAEDFVVAEDLPKALQGVDRCQGHDAEQVEFRMRRKDGSELRMRSSVSLLLGENGEYLGALVFFADCPVRKNADAGLRDQSAIFEFAQDAVALCDASLHILYWSKGAARLYGWTADEVLGRAALEVISNKSAPGRADEVLSALQEQGQWRGELSQVSKDGRPLMVDVRLDLIPAAVGKFGSVLFVATDMTQRRAREAQVLREQRLEAASTLARGLVLELNNTLGPILLSVQMLRTRQLGPADQELLATIETSAQRSTDLLKQTLIFARGVEGERVVIQPARLIKDMAAIARELLPRNIRVLAEAPKDVWTLKGDPTQLQQVLLKLSVNAREAMPEGGTLCFRARNLHHGEASASLTPMQKPGFYVMLEVQDTGPGIPAALQDRVFEPFFATNERGSGMGASLSIVLGIVRSHGGTIEVQSQPDTGTTFTLLFPAFPNPTELSSETEPELPAGRGELILVVENEAVLRDITRTALKKHGYEVLAAGDDTEAIGLLAQHRGTVKLVLTNISVPSVDGPSLAGAAHRIDPNLRIIAASALGAGFGQADKLTALRSLGIGRVLAKPYSTRDLLRAVNDELRSSTRAPEPGVGR